MSIKCNIENGQIHRHEPNKYMYINSHFIGTIQYSVAERKIARKLIPPKSLINYSHFNAIKYVNSLKRIVIYEQIHNSLFCLSCCCCCCEIATTKLIMYRFLMNTEARGAFFVAVDVIGFCILLMGVFPSARIQG